MSSTKELIKKVRKIEIKTKRLSNHIFGGEYHSAFKGRGMTFSEVRKYQYGDDIRAIDWNVTARYNQPYVKVFEEERELTMMLMIDISGSESFGTSHQFKKDTVIEIAATLAFSAIQNNDKVGLMLFANKVELYIPPKKGRSHVLRIIRDLIEFKPKTKKTNINEALKFLSSVTKKKAIVFLLSDFIDDNYQKTLKIVANRHDITGIRVFDKRDEEMPNIGMVSIIDAETGKKYLVNTNSKSVRTQYKANALQLKNEFLNSFKKSGAGTINMQIDESYVKKLLGYFKTK